MRRRTAHRESWGRQWDWDHGQPGVQSKATTQPIRGNGFPRAECGCGYSGLRCSCWAAFQMLSEQHKSGSVLSSEHIRRADLHFPCTALYISVSGTDRLIANSLYVSLTLLSSAGSNKKRENWSRNPISIVPSARFKVPSLWTMWTCPFLLHCSITTLWHKGWATST